MAELPSQDDLNADVARQRAAMPAWVRLIRPRQWSKNLLVFAALIFANRLLSMDSVGLALMGFASFCLASSSAYVVNDLLDVERDRLHPTKSRRPIASSEITTRTAIVLALILTVSSFAIAAWIGWMFTAVVVTYVVQVHFYSMIGKHVVILDTMLIAAGFVLRAMGGAVAIDVLSSNWFVLCTFFAALFLALTKRRAEKLALRGEAIKTRSVLEQYTDSTLAAYTATAIAATTISYALYVIDASTLYPRLPLTVPFVVFAVFRYYHLVETAGLGEKPEDVFFEDRPFQIGVIAFAMAALAALYLGA